MPRRSADPATLIDQAPLSPSLRALAQRGVMRRLRKGAQIIIEGDHGDTMFIIVEGRLRAYGGASNDDRQITYGEYGPGEYVGEMSLDGGPRSANVEASMPTAVVVVTRRTLEAHIRDDPGFAFELLTKVIWRARNATSDLKQIRFHDVYGRLKAQLEALGTVGPDGRRVILPAPSHQELADRLGCSRPMVSRVLERLEGDGYVQVGRRQLVVLKPLPPRA